MIAESLDVLDADAVGSFSVLTETGTEYLLVGTPDHEWLMYRAPRDRGILSMLYRDRDWLPCFRHPEHPVEVGEHAVLAFDKPELVRRHGRDVYAGTFRITSTVEAIFALYALPPGIAFPDAGRAAA